MASLTWKDIIHVHSPRGIYNTETVFLNFTVETLWQTRPTSYVLYNLHTHERAEVDVTDAVVNMSGNTFPNYTPTLTTHILEFNYNITDLADGSYSLTVRTNGGSTDSVAFTIKTTSVDAAEIPEFHSWIFLLLFMVVTLVVVIIKKSGF